MRRKAAIVVALVGLVLAAAIGAAGSPAAVTMPPPRTWPNLGRVDRSGAERVQEGGGRVRRQERGCDRQGRRRYRPPRSPRPSARETYPRCVELLHLAERRRLLPSGGWIDLAPFLKRDNINTNIFPATTRYYTQYGGTRCALPLLADVYGFYYNKDLFKKAGPRGPRAPSGSSRRTRRSSRPGRRTGRSMSWLRPFGSSASTRTRSAHMPRWWRQVVRRCGQNRSLGKGHCLAAPASLAKNLVDYYGHDKLVKWQTGAGDEWSAPHAFGRGKLAMMVDGEWRVAFLAADHKGLKYGGPDACRRQERYGAGYISRTIIRIPKGNENTDLGKDIVNA